MDTDTRGGDSPEATWRRLHAEEADDRELEEARRVLPCSLWGDAGPAHTLTSTSGLQSREKMDLCCFKPQRLWSSIPAAPGHR